jgi:hypothetical protein
VADRSNVIPFGKYKGQEVDAVRVVDPAYLEWLVAQAWFAEKFRPIYQTIVVAPKESEDTPEHNSLQIRFLDKHFRSAFLNFLCLSEWGAGFEEALAVFNWHDVEFEVLGWDVRISLQYRDQRKTRVGPVFWIECKPTVGDDFPSILRQIKKQASALGKIDKDHHEFVLLVESFAASNVQNEEIERMFLSSDVKIVRLQDLLGQAAS